MNLTIHIGNTLHIIRIMVIYISYCPLPTNSGDSLGGLVSMRCQGPVGSWIFVAEARRGCRSAGGNLVHLEKLPVAGGAAVACECEVAWGCTLLTLGCV